MPDILLFATTKFKDDRGWFMETYNENRERKSGIHDTFVQDNQSFSKLAGTIRGIHFQNQPCAQAKLVRCTRGSIVDYVVDLRRGSPTYGKHVSAQLSAANAKQIYIPVGFGHAFVTLEDSTEISYKVSDFYSAQLDAGVRWDCPDIGINWPVGTEEATLSEKDRSLPLLKDFESSFEYDGMPLRLRELD